MEQNILSYEAKQRQCYGTYRHSRWLDIMGRCMECGLNADQVPKPETPVMTKAQQECSRNYDQHTAHMVLNGECPWCGYHNPDEMQPHLTIEEVERRYGG